MQFGNLESLVTYKHPSEHAGGHRSLESGEKFWAGENKTRSCWYVGRTLEPMGAY